METKNGVDILNSVPNEFYVRINGVVGCKVSSTRDKANTYADRVLKGFVKFEPLNGKVIEDRARSGLPLYTS